jgi:hypothetical protein
MENVWNELNRRARRTSAVPQTIAELRANII